MDKHLTVTDKSVKTLRECFVDDNEFLEFGQNLHTLANFLLKSSQDCETLLRKLNYLINDPKKKYELECEYSYKQIMAICTFTLFARENIELINELVKNVHFEILTNEEIKGLQERIDRYEAGNQS